MKKDKSNISKGRAAKRKKYKEQKTYNSNETRITIFIKSNLEKSGKQTNTEIIIPKSRQKNLFRYFVQIADNQDTNYGNTYFFNLDYKDAFLNSKCLNITLRTFSKNF